jgi:hypothetical protein
MLMVGDGGALRVGGGGGGADGDALPLEEVIEGERRPLRVR